MHTETPLPDFLLHIGKKFIFLTKISMANTFNRRKMIQIYELDFQIVILCVPKCKNMESTAKSTPKMVQFEMKKFFFSIFLENLNCIRWLSSKQENLHYWFREICPFTWFREAYISTIGINLQNRTYSNFPIFWWFHAYSYC